MLISLILKKIELDYEESAHQIIELQGELKKKYEALANLENDKREAEEKLQQQDYDFKNLKIMEAEKTSEISVLKIRKEKLVAERDVIKHKIEEIKTESHMLMTNLVKTQKTFSVKISTHTKLLGAFIISTKLDKLKLTIQKV